MNTLTIYPTFLCPFGCNFCFNKDKNLLNEFLDIEKLDKFLQKNHNKFEKIIISGGEPMNYSKIYFNLLNDKIKEYNTNIQVHCYPFQLTNYRDDVEYVFSYDFLSRPRALEAWENMLRMTQPFDMNITLVPLMFKYHPNAIFQKLSYIKNLRNVEIKPYYKNKSTTWNINDTVCEKFIKLWLSSKINTHFINYNKEKIRHLIGKPSKIEIKEQNNYNLLPDGKLYIDYFDENDIHDFKEIKPSEIDIIKSNKPSCIDFYSKDLQDWAKETNV